jgi:murein DD-endopeptidase MepM/ murein hydrolase activator NlpD
MACISRSVGQLSSGCYRDLERGKYNNSCAWAGSNPATNNSSNNRNNRSNRRSNLGSQLRSGNQLLPGQYLRSQNGQYELILQTDGNLVLYSLRGGRKALWNSRTAGRRITHAFMQGDGNFVLYDRNSPIWNTKTSGRSNYLIMQDDGNAVIYNGRRPLWASENERSRQSASAWILPWKGYQNMDYNRRNGWHDDFYQPYALDFPLPADTPVVSPIDATVVKFCVANNNRHHAIKFRATNGQEFSLIHVKASGVKIGRGYRQGEQIGVVAADTPWNNCARSQGVHLHVGFPTRPFTMGGRRFE